MNEGNGQRPTAQTASTGSDAVWTTDPVTDVGIIGAGRLARGVIASVAAGEAGPFRICGILKRDPGNPAGPGLPVTTRVDDFLALKPKIVIELGGPGALREHAASILAQADLWTVGGAALADAGFERAILRASRQSGHRLRLLSGAIAGLDALAAAATVPGARVTVDASCVGLDDAVPEFEGSAREVLERFHGVNVLAAIAIAGVGLDATRIRYHPHRPDTNRKFTIHVECDRGRFQIIACPVSTDRDGTAIVVSSVIAALRQSRLLLSAA